jgi:hypothetical protein
MLTQTTEDYFRWFFIFRVSENLRKKIISLSHEV